MCLLWSCVLSTKCALNLFNELFEQVHKTILNDSRNVIARINSDKQNVLGILDCMTIYKITYKAAGFNKSLY